MKQITATDTLTLSIPERIQLVEDIWDTIAVDPEAIELTEQDKQISDSAHGKGHKQPSTHGLCSMTYQRYYVVLHVPS